MLLAVAAGYPYDIHLIGDAAFSVMADPDRMDSSDILHGLGELFCSDKKEKYLEKLRELTPSQRLVIVSMARYSDKHIPMRIPIDWLESNLLGNFQGSETIGEVIDELGQNGILSVNGRERYCQFTEELLRIFLSLLIRNQRELEDRRRAQEKTRDSEAEEQIQRESRQRFFEDLGTRSVDEKEVIKAMEELDAFDFEPTWEEEDLSELIEFEVPRKT